MASNENKYRVNQDDKEYILTVAVEGQSFKLACQESKIPNAPNYIKLYSLDNIRQYDGFNAVSSLEDASTTFDKMLSSEKICVNEENGSLKVCVYTSLRALLEIEKPKICFRKYIIYFSFLQFKQKRYIRLIYLLLILYDKIIL